MQEKVAVAETGVRRGVVGDKNTENRSQACSGRQVGVSGKVVQPRSQVWGLSHLHKNV